MIERVLGFKERFAKTEKDISGFAYQYMIGKKDLVPVVSLKWLKECCKKTTKRTPITQDNWDKGHLVGWNQALRYILSEAKKEVEKGGI